VHPNHVSTWKHQAVEGMADVFAKGDRPSGPSEAEIEDLRGKIGRLAVENDFLSQGLMR
jgi:transposase